MNSTFSFEGDDESLAAEVDEEGLHPTRYYIAALGQTSSAFSNGNFADSD